MTRLRTLLAASLVAQFVLSAGTARGGETPEAVRPPKVASIDHVRLEAAGRRWSGFSLAPDAPGGYALLTDDGRVTLIARSRELKPIETTPRPIAAVPGPALAAGLAHADEAVRDRCEQLLRDQGDLALPALAAAANDPSPESRRRALAIVTKLAPVDPKAAQPWIGRARARLTDGDERVRCAAIAAYAAVGADDVRERCEDVLQFDHSARTRHEAIVQLGRRGDLRAIDPLLVQLADCEERSLRIATFDALRRLTGKSFGRDEGRWRSWWKNHRAELVTDPAR